LAGSPARLLDEEAHGLVEGRAAGFLVDVTGARLLAANPAGLAALGLDAVPSDGLPLDRATPALETLAVAAAGAGTTDAEPLSLVFWMPAGPRTVTMLLRIVPVPGRLVVRLVEPVTVAPGVSVPAAAGVVDGPPATDDAATMTEIARRIREGLGGGLVPTDPRPLVFREAAAAPVDATGAAPAPDDPTPPDWPGLRVVSERDLATLAHELRTPLAAIMALAEAMRDERLGPAGNPRYLGYAADIYGSAEHALGVLTGMLEPGQPTLHVVKSDANAIILTCVSILRPLAERSDIQLGHALAAGLPPVLADERALRQILLNLLSNALRHTPAGGEISVTTAYRVDGPVRIEVRDTGPGISGEDLAAIEAEIDSERQGLPPPAGAGGLGLPLVCRLAQANGAEIGIDSKPGRGTRVFLTFARERVAQGTV